jgi:hypothetical protein
MEASIRKVLQRTIQIKNEESNQAKVDANPGAIPALYRKDHLSGLHHSTQQANVYLLSKYIEPQFADAPLRTVTPLQVIKLEELPEGSFTSAQCAAGWRK